MRNNYRKILYSLIFFLSWPILVFSSQDNLQEKINLHYRLGRVCFEHGLYKEAEKEFQKVLELKGETPLVETSKRKAAKSKKEIPIKKNKGYLLGSEKPKEKPKTIRPLKKLSKKEPAETESRFEKIGEYVISPGDTLFISVWENPELTRDVTVRPDSRITFPFVGDILVYNMTIPELKKVLTDRLKEYIRNPDVSIYLKSLGGERVIVLGEVKNPGVYELNNRKTVLEAIAMAGGYTRDAVLNSVMVITGGFRAPKAKRYDLVRALEGHTKNDIVLHGQDIVYVPSSFISDFNYIVSQLIDPITKGAYIRDQYRAKWTRTH